MICVGGPRDGVCIDSWHMNIKCKKDIDRVIYDYTQAKEKANRIQKLISAL